VVLINLHCVFQAESTSATNESVLKVALDHGKASGVIKSHDRVVVCHKVGDSSVVKIIELDDVVVCQKVGDSSVVKIIELDD
jgi:pyruvate kinase